MATRIPLHQIKAFEASARRLSFSRAAEELNVQQPSVSRHIAALEAELGVPLFLRSKPRLTLTKEGEILASAVSQGFDAIRSGLDTLRARKEEDTIVVGASIGFTSLYLLPRLAEFQVRFPDTKIQILTRDQNADFDARQCDAIILFGDMGLEGARSKRIFGEDMVAVCHPDLLAGGLLLTRSELAVRKLLYMTGPDHNGDWGRFFAKTGITVPKAPVHDTYLSYMVYLRAIQNGLGFGIGWRPLLNEYFASGSLAIACDHECRTERGYFCSITDQGANKPGAARFLDWIGQSD